MARLSAAVVIGAGAWDPPREKFQALMDACQGAETMAACTTKFTGVCKSDTNYRGSRFCVPECGKGHGKGAKGFGKGGGRFRGDRKSWGSSHWAHSVGDCDGKAEGKTCSFQKEGTCIPSGKCPIFKGAIVCKANDARAPDFVTAPCDGKNEDDECQHHRGGSGKCLKPKYFDKLVCKSESSFMSHWAKWAEHKSETQKAEATPSTSEWHWNAEKLRQWTGAVPTWWTKDGKPHWTSVTV